jgi:hypothetical protein
MEKKEKAEKIATLRKKFAGRNPEDNIPQSEKLHIQSLHAWERGSKNPNELVCGPFEK